MGTKRQINHETNGFLDADWSYERDYDKVSNLLSFCECQQPRPCDSFSQHPISQDGGDSGMVAHL